MGAYLLRCSPIRVSCGHPVSLPLSWRNSIHTTQDPAGSRYKQSGRWGVAGGARGHLTAPLVPYKMFGCAASPPLSTTSARQAALQIAEGSRSCGGKTDPCIHYWELDLLTLPLKVKQGSGRLEAPAKRETAPLAISRQGKESSPPR